VKIKCPRTSRRGNCAAVDVTGNFPTRQCRRFRTVRELRPLVQIWPSQIVTIHRDGESLTIIVLLVASL
jgi:hypothetical protein